MNRRQVLAGAATLLAGCGAQARTPSTGSPTLTPSDWEDDRHLSAVEGSWPTRRRSIDRTAAGEPVDELRAGWTADCGLGFTDPASPPLVHDGRLIQARDRSLCVYDAVTGREEWSHEFREGGLIGTAAAADGRVYATVAFELLAFDVATGERRRLAVDRHLATEPMVTDGEVVVGTDDSLLIVATDGTTVTELELPAKPVGLAADDEAVFVRTVEGLTRVDRAGWTRQWTYDLPSRPRAASLPLVTEKRVIVTTGRGDLRTVRRTDGRSRSRVQFPSNRLYAPVRTEGRTYVTDEAGRLFVVRDGAVERRVGPAEIDGPSGLAAIDSNRSPVVAGSSVVFPARDGTLVALSTENPDADVRRLAHLPFRVAAPPTIVESAMFINAHPKTYAISI